MSAAAAAEAAPAPKNGKKKLIIIIAAAVLLLGGGGTAALVIMKKKAAEAAAAAEEADDGAAAPAAAHAKAAAHGDHKPPAFVPLEPFVVNLADHDADRYAQIGLTLQVPDEHAGEEIKGYLPAIRNNILLLLAHKTSEDLGGSEGKQKLAAEIRRESLKAMGYEVEAEEAPEGAAAEGEGADKAKAAPRKKKKKAAAPEEVMPIAAVQFSSFIIQ